MTVSWESLDMKVMGKPIPKPTHWDDHPEWFDLQDGYARRIPGRRDERIRWGPIEWGQEFGDYEILCMRYDASPLGVRGQTDHGSLIYHAFVNGRKVDTSWYSLDECLVDAVRFKHEGPRGSSGPRATEYFLRMVGAPEREA